MKSPYSSSANKDVLVAILQMNNYLMCFYWLLFCFVYSLLLAPVLKIRSQYQSMLHSSSKPPSDELQKRWGLKTEEVQVWLFVTWWLRFRFEMDHFADSRSILEVTISREDSLFQEEKRMCEVFMIWFHDYSQHQRWYTCLIYRLQKPNCQF